MTNKEIQEIIISCVDYANEFERYPKDVMKEVYQYIENWYKPINKKDLLNE